MAKSENAPPPLVSLDPDDYHAKYVGWTQDGRQFFLTTPFEPAMAGNQGCEFVALYVFDSSGHLLEAEIENLGPRHALRPGVVPSIIDSRLAGLGPTTARRICVAPFALQRYGSTFGFVLRPPEDDQENWSVEVQPGNYMAFIPPWDSGVYDT